MAIAVETSSTTAFAETATLTLTLPTGTANGDLLIAVIAGEPGGGGTINSVPSGWTLAKQETTDGATWMYYKIASSEGASWNWGFDVSNVCGGGVLRVSGSDNGDPLDQVASQKVSDSPTPGFTSGDIDPTTLSSLFVMVAHATDTSARTISGYAIVTSNPSWTEQFNINESDSGVKSSLAVATAIRPQDSASGDPSYVIDSGSAGADGRLILANFNVEPDVSVSPSVINLTLTMQSSTVTGGAVVTPAVVTVTANIQAPTPATPTPDWSNQSKSSTSWTNQNQS